MLSAAQSCPMGCISSAAVERKDERLNFGERQGGKWREAATEPGALDPKEKTRTGQEEEEEAGGTKPERAKWERARTDTNGRALSKSRRTY